MSAYGIEEFLNVATSVKKSSEFFTIPQRTQSNGVAGQLPDSPDYLSRNFLQFRAEEP
jgi:hypothetical protein